MDIIGVIIDIFGDVGCTTMIIGVYFVKMPRSVQVYVFSGNVSDMCMGRQLRVDMT
jgi:hypothetical protein